MIVTDIKHIVHQVSMTTALKKAIDFLQRPDIHDLVDGRVDIDGELDSLKAFSKLSYLLI